MSSFKTHRAEQGQTLEDNGMNRTAKKPKSRIIDKNIIALAKNIKKLSSQAIADCLPEMNAIIASGCNDKYRIEKLLDLMLDFCWDKQMLELYKRLCRYYYEIDPYVTTEYVLAYRDIWDDSSSRTLSEKSMVAKKKKQDSIR